VFEKKSTRKFVIGKSLTKLGAGYISSAGRIKNFRTANRLKNLQILKDTREENIKMYLIEVC
jgi:hypothetical protein